MTETITTAASADLVVRAAVLSVFDLDWLEPDVAHARGADAKRLADFLVHSCERVVDAHGIPRWRLRDSERLRVLRTLSRQELLAALEATPERPDEPIQHVLEQYLHGTLPPPAALDAAELAGVLQLERWLGPSYELPTQQDIEWRLGWLNLLAPLQRLLARGFIGREDVLTELTAYIDKPTVQAPFVIEGVGGSGKSAVLARLIDAVTARGEMVCYASFDRSWLVQGGAWSLVEEIARQIGLQGFASSPGRQEEITTLRQQVQRYAQRAGYSDIASRAVQQVEPVHPELLDGLGRLVDGRRFVLMLDTLEELARRDSSLAYAFSSFLRQLGSPLPGLRVVAAGRARPRYGFDVGQVWPLTGLSEPDGLRLLRELTGMDDETELLLRIVRMTSGNPLSLHLAADVLRRTGTDPTRLIAIGEGDIQGQLYSRLLEHIKDKRVHAIAHPGLVVRRITPEVIREVLAEPCGIAPLSPEDATDIFSALRSEATLCEPSTDGDGALVHRPDVRALMLPAITRARPAAAHAIHEAAVRYYEQLAPQQRTTDHIARREELYHRLMLKQPWPELDRRWMPSVADELAALMDELPAESQLYLAGQVKGLRLDPEVRAEADDEQWRHSVRPAAESLLERGQLMDALQLLQERRGYDGRKLLPDLEIEALDRLGQLDKALDLAQSEQHRASGVGHEAQLRDLILQQARILERIQHFEEAWELLDPLAQLDRTARARSRVLDDEVRIREIVVLTSLLRIARHSGRTDEVVDALRTETVELSEGTPARVLTRSPSLLRDLAAEIGEQSTRILELATTVRGEPTPDAEPTSVAHEQFIWDTDASQGYLPVFPQPSKLVTGHGLGIVRTMPHFRAFVKEHPQLTREQRSVLVEQARLLIDELYVHLPLKRAMHAVDPVQRLRLLAHRMDTMDDRAFHSELLDIFLSVRDPHTNYLLPAPFGGQVAFLGILVERFASRRKSRGRSSSRGRPIVGGRPRFTISKVSHEVLMGESLHPGAVVTHWNGAPIELAVWRNAQRETGSNLAARLARGLESLTMRYLDVSLPPDEDWVDLRYETYGETHEARLTWFVASSAADVFGGEPPATGVLSGLTTPVSRLVGLDLRTELSRRTKKVLFAPEAVREERRVAEVTAGDGPAVPGPTPQQRADNIIATSRPDDLSATLVDTDHGRFGYLRLWTFQMKDANIVAFLNEVIRLLDDEFPPEGLIIDVRGNGGGFVIAAEILLQLLTPKRITPEPAQFLNGASTLQLCGVVDDMMPWAESIRQATETGAQFSIGISLSPEELVNIVGQVYHGPVVLITDALCYSACDIFAAGFVDHEIGDVVGVDANTGAGAGGANVLEHHDLLGLWSGGPLTALPGSARMRVSLRRTLRVGINAGQPLEELGVVPDFIHEMTLDDLLQGNRDLLNAAGKILSGKTTRQLKAEVVTNDGGTANLRLTATAASSLDVYVNGRPQAVGAPALATGTEVQVPVPPGESVIRIEAFADRTIVGNRQLRLP